MNHFPRIYDYTMTSRIGTRPISAMEIAQELKIDIDEITGDFQTYIESLIDAAVLFAEKCTKRVLINSAFTAYLDGFYPGALYEIRRSPLNTIESISVVSGGASSVVSSDVYYFAQSPLFSVLGLSGGYSWPTSDNIMHSVAINFTAGYTTIPADLKKAVMMYVGQLYANRGDCDLTGPNGGAVTQCSLPAAVKNIFNMYRIRDIKVGM